MLWRYNLEGNASLRPFLPLLCTKNYLLLPYFFFGACFFPFEVVVSTVTTFL